MPGVRFRLPDDAHRWHRWLGVSGVGEQQRQSIDGDLGGRDTRFGRSEVPAGSTDGAETKHFLRRMVDMGYHGRWL